MDFCDPFLILGDFNQVEFIWEKTGYNAHKLDGADTFTEWKMRCELVDIPFKGPKFTWCNNRLGRKRTYERLDKALGSKDWMRWYPHSGIKHFPIQCSDHAPIVLSQNLVNNTTKSPYRLEAWNFEFKEAEDIVKENWHYSLGGSPAFMLLRKLSSVRNALRKWSLDKKGGWKKKWTDFDDQLCEALDVSFTGRGEGPYEEVHSKLIEFTKAVGIFWRQRAKLKWQVDGDTCIKFFFNWVRGRAGKNFILGIKKQDGDWTYDIKEIGVLFSRRFQEIFNPEGVIDGF